MHRSDHQIGITPIILKRAGYYLSLGVGVYHPNHPHFDKVVVSSTYSLTANPENDLEWSQGALVAFYKDDRRVRWVDFGCRVTGVGGDSIIREVREDG